VNDTAHVGDPRDEVLEPDVSGYFRRLLGDVAYESWRARRIARAPDDPEREAAERTDLHRQTPTIAYFDGLARERIRSVHHRTLVDGVEHERVFKTRFVTDIEGNQREVIDPEGRCVVRQTFDLLSSVISVRSADAGSTLTLLDVGGKTLCSWDGLGRRTRFTYDELRRPRTVHVRSGEGPERLVERTIYGEAHPDAEDRNLRTRYSHHFDGAGIVVSARNDFKGNALTTTRFVARAYREVPDWTALDAVTDTAVIAAAPGNGLDPGLTVTTAYDARNRPVEITTPDRSVLRPTFNDAGYLESLDVCIRGALQGGERVWTEFVTAVEYNARGQRTRIAYGNGVTTAYAYDDDTERLVRIVSRRDDADFPADCEDGDVGPCGLQNLRLTYDPMGNVVRVTDAAQQTIYFGGDALSARADYRYDSLYRLIEATGREHEGDPVVPQSSWNDIARVGLAHPGDALALRRYTEAYRYDSVGNLLELVHEAGNPGSWTRRFRYEEPSPLDPGRFNNRLTDATVGHLVEPYTYDAHGNTLTMPHVAELEWEHNDRLRRVDRGGGGNVYFLYDANGQRIRKVVERQNGSLQEDRIYVGSYELHREYAGNGRDVTRARETLHVMDDSRRIALIETRTEGMDAGPEQLTRFQLDNHIGSASIEVDRDARVISYEEYHPFGSTAYQAQSAQIETPKRYRFTAKERDDETGLAYHGARYYAPWLCRWVSADPAGLVDGTNVYAYARDNPVRFSDPTGHLTWGQWAGIGAAIVVGTVVTVATAGLAGPVVGAAAATVIGGIVGGAAGGAIAEVTEAAVDNRPITAANVGRAALIGGVAGGAFAGAGVAVAAAARSAVGQAVATSVSRSGVVQGARAVATRVAGSAVGQGTRRIAQRAAQSAIGRGAAGIGRSVGSGLRAVHEGAERLGTSIGARIPGTPASRAAAGYVRVNGRDVLVGTSRSQMRREAERAIAADPNHRLRFLLDESGHFKPTRGLSHPELANSPDRVQMGHIASDKLGDTERLMLQDAWENQFNNVTIETPSRGGAVLDQPAVAIGDIAVSAETGRTWEAAWAFSGGAVGIPPGTTALAPRIPLSFSSVAPQYGAAGAVAGALDRR
jgi:RHS repeat-associated protein